MKKLTGLTLAGALMFVLISQISQVHAKSEKSADRPVTGPITGPGCKPGWGFGDKNHCHSGPPGQVNK